MKLHYLDNCPFFYGQIYLGPDSIPGADSNLGADSTPGADSTLESAPAPAYLSIKESQFSIRKLVES